MESKKLMNIHLKELNKKYPKEDINIGWFQSSKRIESKVRSLGKVFVTILGGDGLIHHSEYDL